jgi:hypothetical protein
MSAGWPLDTGRIGGFGRFSACSKRSRVGVRGRPKARTEAAAEAIWSPEDEKEVEVEEDVEEFGGLRNLTFAEISSWPEDGAGRFRLGVCTEVGVLLSAVDGTEGC